MKKLRLIIISMITVIPLAALHTPVKAENLCTDVSSEICNVASLVDSIIATQEAVEDFVVGDAEVDADQALTGPIDSLAEGGCSLSVSTPRKDSRYIIAVDSTFSCNDRYDLGIKVYVEMKKNGVWKRVGDSGNPKVELDSRNVSDTALAPCSLGSSRRWRGVAFGVALRRDGTQKDADSKVGPSASIPCPEVEEIVQDPLGLGQ